MGSVSRHGIVLMACGIAIAQAQTRPPDGAVSQSTQEILLQQERERALRQQLEQTPDVRLPSPEQAAVPDRLPTDEKPCFSIEQIELKGSEADRFRWVLDAANLSEDPVIGRCLGTVGINIVTKRAQNAVIARGYITTRILVEPQDISSGQLVLTVIPGRVRAIRFAADSDPRVMLWNTMAVQPGDLLNLRDVEQSLENLRRVPTVEAEIQIEPAVGADVRPGDSDLVIAWKQGTRYRGSLGADNSGTRATGVYTGTVTASADNLLTFSDLLYISYVGSLSGSGPGNQGSRNFTGYYSVPFRDWLLALSANRYDYYQPVAGANATIVYRGDNRNGDATLTRIVYRDAVRKTALVLRGWTRSSKNFIDDTEVEVQRRRMSGWAAGAAHREFIGASTLDLNLGYRRGTGALGALPAPEEAFGEGTAREILITADALLAIPFRLADQRLRYSLAWRAQWNRTAIVPQDRFSIGNRYTVRGFDGNSVLVGPRGWLIRNDLGAPLGESGQEIYVGADYGTVSGPTTRFLVGDQLAGAVVGLRGGYRGLAYDFSIGKPLYQPAGFVTDSTTFAFNVSWSF